MTATERTTFVNEDSIDAAPVLADASSAWGRWVLAAFLFVCFFIATQDLQSPLFWRSDEGPNIAEWVGRVSQGQAGRQIGFLALAGVSAIALIVPAPRGGTLSGRVRIEWTVLYPLVALVAWACLSLLWSHDRTLTAKRLVVFGAMVTGIAATVKHFTLRDLIFAAGFYGIASYAIGLYAELAANQVIPYGGEGFRLAGAMHPNHLGLTSAVLALSMFYGLTISRRRPRQILFAMGLMLALLVLFATRSRTSFAAALLALSLFAALRSRPEHAMAVAFVGLLFVGVVAFLFQSGLLGPVWEVALMGRDESSVRTLTGRTDIWAFAWNELSADPARIAGGFGHDSFWNDRHTDAVSRRVGFTISEAHSAYLESMLNLGIVGVGAWLLAILMAGWRWMSEGRTRRGRWRAEAAFSMALLALALSHGLIESTFAHAQFVTFVLFATCLFAALRPIPRAADELETDAA